MPVSHHSCASTYAVMVGLALLFGTQISGQTAGLASPPATREARWQQDLDCFADQFPKLQMDFKKLYPRRTFQRQLAAIRQSVSKATDAEVILDLFRLVASAHVAHTRADIPPADTTFHRLPLLMHWYSDGLAVIGTVDEYRGTLGTRVVRIGSMTPEQLEAAVAPYISYETDAWIHVQSPSFMVIAELLQHLGLTGTDGSVEFRLAKPDGTEFTRKISPVAMGVSVQQISLYDVLHIPVPLRRKQPGKYYWYDYLADSQTLYLQYNVCNDDPQLPFADFTKAMFDFADAHPIRRVIVDLRSNGGGNSEVIRPLEEGLHARSALSQRGHLYTLISPQTFSSGLLAATDFHRDFKAILVGEPLSEKPNSYGEIGFLTLPNSHVQVLYSTKYFRLEKKKNSEPLAPDIFAPPSFADLLAGRDPALEAALKHPLN